MRTVRYQKPEMLPDKLTWDPNLTEDHLDRLCKNYNLSLVDVENPVEIDLRNRLLSFGGAEVLFNSNDPYIERYLQDSEFWYSGESQFINMKNPRPYFSAIDFYKWEPKRYQFVIGFAMDEYGVWMPHAWTLRRLKTKEDRVTEVLKPLCGYYGIILEPEEVESYREFILKGVKGKSI